MKTIIQKITSLILFITLYPLSTLVTSSLLDTLTEMKISKDIAIWEKVVKPEPENYKVSLIQQPLSESDYITWIDKGYSSLLIQGYCKQYQVPKGILSILLLFVYENPFQYKGKVLPKNLSGRDLRGFVFTGCTFNGINLTDTQLDYTLLGNTTCDYTQALKANRERSNSGITIGREEDISKYLEYISRIYPQLKDNYTAKVILLHTASGLSQVPFYQDVDLETEMMYWSCEWIQFRRTMLLVNKWSYTLDQYIIRDALRACWTTNYPQEDVTIQQKKQVSHASFDKYIQDFTEGLISHNCKSESAQGFAWYQKNIIQNIQELKNAYLKVEGKELQQEVCDIADALSKSYQIQEMVLLNHYLFYQRKIMRLRHLTGLKIQNRVNYSLTEGASKEIRHFGKLFTF